MTVNPISQRYPFELRDQPPEVVQAHRYAFSGLVDLNQAVASLRSQIVKLSPISSVTSTSGGGGGSTPIPPTPNPFPGLGAIRDETGVTTYTTVAGDSGILLIFSDASPVAVSLNSSLATPYFFFATNGGAGVVTFTPTTGLINGGASWPLPKGGLFMVVFNGTNWTTSDVLTLAQTITNVTHKWLNSYDATTGLFTQTQPDYSDLTGLPTLPATKTPVAGEYLTGYDSTTGLFSQSTPAGISVTITTAALTTLGTQGSQTFTNGILTAQTPAT